MANLTGKDAVVKVDNFAGSLTDITSHLTSESITGAQNILEDSALGDDERTFVHGLAGGSFPLSGFWNTTTEAIYGPMIGNRPSTATWTAQVQHVSGLVHRGEYLVGNIQVSGAPDTIQTFSVDYTLSGVMIRTSVAL